MSKEQQERILKDFDALDEDRQQQLAEEAARLVRDQQAEPA
jgi:hypothetical protein